MNNSKNKNFLLQAFSLVFKDSLFVVLSLSLASGLLLIYYFLLLKVTTLKVFFDSNTPFYNWTSFILTLFISIFFGIAVSLLIWQTKQQKETNPAHIGNSFLGSFLGALSIGCPVCGAFLASVLGIAGGLFAFPFQGLEIKIISLFLLGFAILSSAKTITKTAKGICEPTEKSSLFRIENGKLVFALNKKTLKSFWPGFLGFTLLVLVIFLPVIANKFNLGLTFQKSLLTNIPKATTFQESLSLAPQIGSTDLISKINPPQGYTVNATYGDLGPKLLAAGAIDFEKMKSLYEGAGAPLTDEQIKILTEGSNEKIKITPENSYFLLNFLWALGLANRNPILDEGPMMKYGGKEGIGNFASTGGWTLGKLEATELYSNFEIIKLTQGQQKILENFSFNSYRPCCSNPTSFPDCNHGMAALALGEIMAFQRSSADEIFEAFKYFNAFWFPQTYFDVAKYFQAKEGKDWKDVDSRQVSGKDYSTPQGWQKVRQWLIANNLIEEPPAGGGGCGA